LILAAASPLLATCILEAGHIEDLSCIILPDFTGEEVESFLSILYLAETGGPAAMGGPLFSCLMDGSAAVAAASPLDRLLKAERTAAEIKMEDVEMKIKKKVEDLELGCATEDNSDSKTEDHPGNDSVFFMQTKTTASTARSKSDQGPFCCSTCGKSFRARRILKMHEQVHAEPRLMCPEAGCEKRFRKRFNLKAHVDVVHRGYRHLPCELCGKQFYNESKLKEHASTHSADKFICQHCPRNEAFSELFFVFFLYQLLVLF